MNGAYIALVEVIFLSSTLHTQHKIAHSSEKSGVPLALFLTETFHSYSTNFNTGSMILLNCQFSFKDESHTSKATDHINHFMGNFAGLFKALIVKIFGNPR